MKTNSMLRITEERNATVLMLEVTLPKWRAGDPETRRFIDTPRLQRKIRALLNQKRH